MSESEPAEPAASRRPPPPITRGEWALILVLVAIHFTHMVDFVIVMPLGKRFMDELGVNDGQFAWLVSVYALAAGVTTLLASLLMDRLDRRAVLLTMYGGFGISTLFCGIAWNYESLVVARTAAGACGGLAAVTIMAVIGDLFPPEKRGRAVGAITSAFAVASIIGIPLGLVIAKHAGRAAPFYVLGGLSLLVWVVAALRLPPVREHLKHERRHPLRELAAVVKEGNHQRVFVFTFFLVLGTFTLASFSAPYLMGTNGWDEGDLAVIYSVGGVFTLLGMSVIGRMADHYPRLPLFRVLGAITIVATLTMALLPPCPLWVATVVLGAFMVFSAGRMVPAQAMILGAAEPRYRGAFVSLNTAVQHLGTALAPLLASLFIVHEGKKIHGFATAGFVAVACAVVSLVLAGTLRTAKAGMTPQPIANEPKGDEPREPVAVSPPGDVTRVQNPRAPANLDGSALAGDSGSRPVAARPSKGCPQCRGV